MHTVKIMATDATFTPSRNAENFCDFRILGTNGFSNATNTVMPG